MSFDEHIADCRARGLACEGAAEIAAKMAWDTALCAASAASFDRGTLRTAGEIHAAITNLHTWAKPETSTL